MTSETKQATKITNIELIITKVVKYKATISEKSGGSITQEFDTVEAAKRYINRTLDSVWNIPKLEKVESVQVS